MQTLPEDFLFNLLPKVVQEADTRGLTRALLGGFQDRLSDLRVALRHVSDLWSSGDPVNGSDVLLVRFQTTNGVQVARSIVIDENVPSSVLVALAGGQSVATWAAGVLGVEEDAIVDVARGADPLMTFDASTIGLLATTIGAVASSDEAMQRALVATHFQRLKFKGTARGFEVLGRMLGFDDVVFLPLWGRMSPRYPGNVGDHINGPDFSFNGNQEPTISRDEGYNPNVLDDGPYYYWEMSCNVANSTKFYSQVNGNNPYFRVTVGDFSEINHRGLVAGLTGQTYSAGDVVIRTGYGTYVAKATMVTPPPDTEPNRLSDRWQQVLDIPDGTYTFSGGGPNTCASVQLNASLRAVALAAGDAFNGLDIIVSTVGSDHKLAIQWRLSDVKFRTSLYDLNLGLDMDRYAEDNTISVQPNEALPGVSPHRPWSGSNTPRTQAVATERQLDLGPLLTLGTTVATALNDERPATRTQRSLTFGLVMTESVLYALYEKSIDLFTYSAQFGPVTYNVTNVVFLSTFDLDVVAGDVVTPLTLEQDGDTTLVSGMVDGHLLVGQFNASSYSFGTDTNHIQLPDGAIVRLSWRPPNSDVVHDEPTDTPKLASNIEGVGRPEDDLVFDNMGIADEVVPKMGPKLRGDDFSVGIQGAEGTAILPVAAAFDHHGVMWKLGATRDTQVEAMSDPKSNFRIPVASPFDIGNDVGTQALAVSRAGRFDVGWQHGVLLANPAVFDALMQGMVFWAPFNETPGSKLEVCDVITDTNVIADVGPDDRVWDYERGYGLKLNCKSVTMTPSYDEVPQSVTLSMWIKPLEMVVDTLADNDNILLKWGQWSFKIGTQGGYLVLASVYTESDGSTHTPFTNVVLTIGQFNHVGIIISGDQAKMFKGSLIDADVFCCVSVKYPRAAAGVCMPQTKPMIKIVPRSFPVPIPTG